MPPKSTLENDVFTAKRCISLRHREFRFFTKASDIIFEHSRENVVEKSKVTKAILNRLPQYLDLLQKICDSGVSHISATRIASELSFGEVQVRKDLNIVCGKGKPKLGYDPHELKRSIELCLGRHQKAHAVLVGAGKLGKALLDYDEFEKFGVDIAAVFDKNEQSFKLHKSVEVLPMSRFREFCQSNDVRIGIITVGKGSAQEVCDLMVESGIEAIWNFAPCKLSVPENVAFLQENLALSLAYLNNCLLSR